MTVGATGRRDGRPPWSNFGPCVDWFAPGVDITSAEHWSSTASDKRSGTSMAAPHTAGVAALYLEANPGASPDLVRAALFTNATKGVVTFSRSTNNHLLFTQ